MNGLIPLIKPIIVIASVITLNLNNLLAPAKLFFITVQALVYLASILPLILYSVYTLTPPTTNQCQILYPALVKSLITLPKSLMIKITQQSNGEQALSSLSFLQLLIITPLRCYSILLKCRQLTNQLLWARPYYPADAYSWVVWERFLIKVAGEGVSTPPPSHTAPHSPAVNNIHHSLDLAHICPVQLVVCACASAWRGLDKWRRHMVGPDVVGSYVHSSSKTKTSVTIGAPLPSKARQPICFLPARLVHSGYWLFFCFCSFQLFCIWQESGSVAEAASAINVVEMYHTCVPAYFYYSIAALYQTLECKLTVHLAADPDVGVCPSHV